MCFGKRSLFTGGAATTTTTATNTTTIAAATAAAVTIFASICGRWRARLAIRMRLFVLLLLLGR